ncbi:MULTISPECIES: helix-turn-helix transcriptional regulator [Rhodococcus]|nr:MULTISPECIES: AraC family transcriptional regulator [Rhodococcus]KHJ71857.1 DNA-binding protein [Rhodococcus sp. Chr-9]
MRAAGQRWSGGVSLTPGLMTFTGDIGDAPAHAHAAVQVLFVARGRLILTDATGHTIPAVTAIIPPGVVHQVHTEPGTSGFLAFLDPDSTTAHAALARLGEQPRQASTTWVSVTAPAPPASAGVPARRSSHPVVAEALRRATEWVGGPPPLSELAADIGMSASRLSHIFTAQVGLPYVAWRRWVRLQLGFTVVRDGGSLTQAAHTAGFADSAHLTRTCRDLIGISPTEALTATGWRPPPVRDRTTTA